MQDRPDSWGLWRHNEVYIFVTSVTLTGGLLFHPIDSQGRISLTAQPLHLLPSGEWEKAEFNSPEFTFDI